MKPSKIKMKTSMVLLLSTLVLTACSHGSATSKTSSTTTSSSATTSQSAVTTTDYFKESDYDTSYDEKTASTIQLSGSTAKVSGDGVSVSGSTVTIASEGTYIIFGSSENVQIVVKAADTAKVHLVIKDVTMTGDKSPIKVEEADKVTMTLAKDSKNTISDTANNSDADADAAIFSASDLVMNGEGSLTVNGKSKNAIKANDDLRITGGTYTISAVKHGFNVNDALNITNATVEVTASEDALHSDNDKDTSLGNIYLKDATITATAGDNGIHASNNLVIDGGKVTVGDSNEGLEGAAIHIISGKIDVTAKDDGINAANSSRNSGIYLTIDGGTINVTAGGDGLDSNGDLTVNGGTLFVSGAPDNGNGALDYDGIGKITGGNVFIVGSAGMAMGFGEDSSQASIMASISGKAGSTITVKDSSGKVLATYTATQVFETALVSSSAIKEGETYTVEVDGQSTTATASLTTQTVGGMGGGPGGGGSRPGQR